MEYLEQVIVMMKNLRASSGFLTDGEDQKDLPSLKSVTHTYNDETWHSYTLPKEDMKKI